MTLVLLVIGCATGFIARFAAGGIVEPVNQLIDVVHALNTLDFSQQVWMDRSIFCTIPTTLDNRVVSPPHDEGGAGK